MIQANDKSSRFNRGFWQFKDAVKTVISENDLKICWQDIDERTVIVQNLRTIEIIKINFSRVHFKITKSYEIKLIMTSKFYDVLQNGHFSWIFLRMKIIKCNCRTFTVLESSSNLANTKCFTKCNFCQMVKIWNFNHVAKKEVNFKFAKKVWAGFCNQTTIFEV